MASEAHRSLNRPHHAAARIGTPRPSGQRRRMDSARALVLIVLAGCSNPQPAAPPAQPRDDSRKPPAIRTSNVPAIAPDIFERLQQYQNVRSASFEDWAPDGKSMLISTRFGTTSQLHLVHEPGGRREQITFFDEPVNNGRFLPDGSILFTMGRGGDEQWQVYRLDRKTGRAALLTDGQSRHTLGALNRAGTRVAVGINKPKERDTNVFLMDPKTGATELLMAVKGTDWRSAEWSRDDSKLLLLRYVSANESYPHVMDVATRALTPIPIPGGGKAAHDAMAWADDKSVWLSSDAKGEFQQLARVDLATMKYDWTTADVPWDVDAMEVSPDGKRTAYVVNEDGMSRLTVDGRRVELPVGVAGGLRFSPDGRRLALTLNRPDAPGDVYALEDGKLVRWTYSEIGGLDASTFVAPSRESVKSFDGTVVPFYVYCPKSDYRSADRDTRAPVIISIHGGPEGQYRPFFSGQTQFLTNELGCAVIGPNVRGSSGYGKTYLAADNAEKREDSVKDIGAILDWIAKQPDLDASRVCVTGGSYGGYMVLASLVHFGERLRAGVDVVGIANFTTFLKTTSAYRQDLRRVEYGDERDPKMQAVFERISPSNHADRIKSALLVAHGVNDPRVPFSEAELIAAKAKGPVWTVYAANEGHGFARKENRDYLTAVNVAFFREFLLK